MPLTNLSPYLAYSLKLTTMPRQGGGNMFRHQMETLSILLEYQCTEPVLLKASLIHDLVEDGEEIGFISVNEISTIDEDGEAVFALVKEVSRRVIGGLKEPKSEFLLRIMLKGSVQAKILKLADRISNINALLLTRDNEFIKKYIHETEHYILPYAEEIHPAMAAELRKSIEFIYKNILP